MFADAAKAAQASAPVAPIRSRPPSRFKKPTESRRKWVVRAVSADDKKKWEEIRNEYGPKATVDRDRVRSDYDEFCKLSGLEKNGESLGWCLGQMANKLAPGTVDGYIAYASEGSRTADVNYVRKTAQAFHADATTGHAPDINGKILKKFVNLAPMAHQPVLFILMSTGMRVKDIARLRRRQVGYRKKSSLRVQIRLSKTAKRRALRTTLTIPSEWLGVVPASFTCWLKNTCKSKDAKMLKGYTAAKVNAILRRVGKKFDMPRPTTYSFRREYMNFVREWCGGDSDLERSYTKHMSTSITEAHYVRFEEDPELESNSDDAP